MNKAIIAVVVLILLAPVVKGLTAGNGYLAEVQRAAQQRAAYQAAYRGMTK